MNKLSFNVLVILNNPNWTLYDIKNECNRIKQWYADTTDLTFYVTTSSYNNLEWQKEIADPSNPNVGGQPYYRITDNSYDKTFTRHALRWGIQNDIPIHFVCAVINTAQWRGSVVGGWCSDNTNGIQELTVHSDSPRHQLFYQDQKENTFFAYLTHELCHGIAKTIGVEDTTHRFLQPLSMPARTSTIQFKPTWKYTYYKNFGYKIRAYWRTMWGI